MYTVFPILLASMTGWLPFVWPASSMLPLIKQRASPLSSNQGGPAVEAPVHWRARGLGLAASMLPSFAVVCHVDTATVLLQLASVRIQ